MHLCSSLDAVCMICGELKAPHVRPRGYTPALTDIKAKGCTVNDPNVDVDGFASILTAFVDSGKFSATWFLPPSKNVFSIKPSLQLSSKLLAQDPMEALPTSDDWSHMIDGFTSVVYPQVPATITSYPYPSSKRLKTRCVESKIFGDGPKSTKLLSRSYYQHAPIKVDISQFFTYMRARHGVLPN